MASKRRLQEITPGEEVALTRQQPHRKSRDHPLELFTTWPPPRKYAKYGEELKPERQPKECKPPFDLDGALRDEDREDMLATSVPEITLYNRVYDYYNKPNPSHILPRIEGTRKLGPSLCASLSKLICCPIFRNQSCFYLKNAIKLATCFRKLQYGIDALDSERSAKKYMGKLLWTEQISEHKLRYAAFIKEIELAVNKKGIPRGIFTKTKEDENAMGGDLEALSIAWDVFVEKNPDFGLMTVAKYSKDASFVRTVKDTYEAKQEYLLSRYAKEEGAGEDRDAAAQENGIDQLEEGG